MAISLHPSIDRGIKQGAKEFAGGTLSCKCAVNPVTVALKSNVAFNHACGCTKCWKPAGAAFSVVAVISRDNLEVTANEGKLKIVDPAAVIRFAPIVAPKQVPWGEKAFTGYLGADRGRWDDYDSTVLMRRSQDAKHRVPILIDQGLADSFLEQQLRPHLLEEAAKEVGYPLTVRRHSGYDHGYYFISSFIEEHLRHHAAILRN